MEQRLWNKNYTMVVGGQVASLFANNILNFALSLYVLDLTGSPGWFGTVMAVSMIPTILLMPFGGMAADRINKRNMMVGMDIVTGGATAITGLLIFGSHPLLAITCLLVILSVIEAFYTPCVQASIPLLQREENLVKANGIVNHIAMSSNIIGPVLAGILYSFMGLMPILWIAAACFFGAAVMEVFIRIPVAKQQKASGMMDMIKTDFRDTYHYMVKDQRELLKIMPAIAVVNLSASAVVTVGGPFIVRIMLGMGSEYYGFATGCVAAAGLIGGLVTVMLADKISLGNTYKTLVYAGLSLLPLTAACYMRFSDNAVFVIMTLCFMAIQIFACIFSIFAMSAVQRRTPVQLLGKVMAFVTAVAICAEPVGRGAYGFAFEVFRERPDLVLLLTAVITVAAGYSTKGPLGRMER